ncbi:hypothetical protein [Shouchella patagoniensis]|uniref:hypothetical protein n=1 Tax=Shouchella patagoniensis TaxID=228576 RepID=UPI000994C8F6|nr:hypothetical protein [Shouchella patagoniensis]
MKPEGRDTLLTQLESLRFNQIPCYVVLPNQQGNWMMTYLVHKNVIAQVFYDCLRKFNHHHYKLAGNIIPFIMSLKENLVEGLEKKDIYYFNYNKVEMMNSSDLSVKLSEKITNSVGPDSKLIFGFITIEENEGSELFRNDLNKKMKLLSLEGVKEDVVQAKAELGENKCILEITHVLM